MLRMSSGAAGAGGRAGGSVIPEQLVPWDELLCGCSLVCGSIVVIIVRVLLWFGGV